MTPQGLRRQVQKTRRVCRWRDQAMVRSVGAGAAFLAMEKNFRRIMGYPDLWALDGPVELALDGRFIADECVLSFYW
jgi:hypothetical protein